MTAPITSFVGRGKEARWQFWANVCCIELGWPNCTGMPWEYVVCDRRSKTGKGAIEMVHIDGHDAKSIRKQISDIIRGRK